MLWRQYVRRNDRFSQSPNINLSVVFLSGERCRPNILLLWQPWHRSKQQIEFLPRGWYRYKCVWHFVSYRLWITRETEIMSWQGVWSGRWRWGLFHTGGTWCQRLSRQSGLLIEREGEGGGGGGEREREREREREVDGELTTDFNQWQRLIFCNILGTAI